jgi:hypothetical protein
VSSNLTIRSKFLTVCLEKRHSLYNRWAAGKTDKFLLRICSKIDVRIKLMVLWYMGITLGCLPGKEGSSPSRIANNAELTQLVE